MLAPIPRTLTRPEALPDDAVPPSLDWRHSYAELGPAFHCPVAPQPLPGVHLVACTPELAARLGLSPDWLASPAGVAAFGGVALPPGARPVATVYSGHQFGHWAGQLGDGRALLLGELPDADGQTWEVQLKGAGLTPYSRMGDGRAVLRSSIREFLASEALHALGIPTTRALCLVGSPAPVYRETVETAAVVTRVAPSFVRFGHFEHFAATGRVDELRVLADHVIDRHYPACREAADGSPVAALLAAVTARTAELVAAWQAAGFCHGVLNTDNMSILGLTLDYGPFQFMDAFDPGHICNHSDTTGRYAWRHQPGIAYWNLYCLAQALMPLIGDPQQARAAVEPFRERFGRALQARMAAKLGLTPAAEGLDGLVESLLPLLAAGRVDHTLFWRRLSEHRAGADLAPVRDLFPDRPAFDAWMLRYQEQWMSNRCGEAAEKMLKTNPRVVLRNHLAETAIRAARLGDFGEVRRLQQVLQRPFDADAGTEADAGLPPDWAAGLSVSCSS